MSHAYRFAKSAYRTLVPASANAFFFSGKSAFSRLVLKAKARLEQSAAHDELYDRAYFLRQDEAMKISGPAIAASLHERLAPKSVIDVGCGSGAVLAALKARGIEATGLEYAEGALDLCRAKGLQVHKFDLEAEVRFDGKADIALSTEVAEHLPEAVADRYVELLFRIGNLVIMTAATPGQGGTDHVNELPNEYWIEKFLARGFVHDPQRDMDWRTDWRNRAVDQHRANNVMVFGPAE